MPSRGHSQSQGPGGQGAGMAEQWARQGQQEEGRSWQHTPELVEVTEGPTEILQIYLQASAPQKVI